MTISIKRINAIVQKELKDSFKNWQVLLMALVPIMFAFVFSQMQAPEEEALIFVLMPLLMALTMTCAFVQSMIIAEEKEKHTLRVLMLSPATSFEVLIGKSILSFLLSLATVLACFVLSGQSIPYPVVFIPITVICIIFFIAIGTVIGLFAKTMSETSLTGLPVMFLFMMGPTFTPLFDIDWVTTINSYLITQNYADVMLGLASGEDVQQMIPELLNIIIWTVLAVGVSLFLYQRKRFD